MKARTNHFPPAIRRAPIDPLRREALLPARAYGSAELNAAYHDVVKPLDNGFVAYRVTRACHQSPDSNNCKDPRWR